MNNTWQYILSDYYRYKGKKAPWLKVLLYTFANHCFAYSFWLRVAASKNPIMHQFGRIRLKMASRKHCMQISYQAKIGYGLYIGHGISMVVNPNAIIGNNCNLSQGLTIGTNYKKSAVIGDNVYIGPSVCLIEDVKIGKNVTIGAGSIVTKDIPENSTAVGNPAKILNSDNPGRFIKNPWPLNA